MTNVAAIVHRLLVLWPSAADAPEVGAAVGDPLAELELDVVFVVFVLLLAGATMNNVPAIGLPNPVSNAKLLTLKFNRAVLSWLPLMNWGPSESKFAGCWKTSRT